MPAWRLTYRTNSFLQAAAPPPEPRTRRSEFRQQISLIGLRWTSLTCSISFQIHTNGPCACFYQCLTILPLFILSGASPAAVPSVSDND